MIPIGADWYFVSPWPNDSVITVYVGLGLFAVAVLVHILTGKPHTAAAFVRRRPIVLLPTLLAMNLFWLLERVPWFTASTPAYHPLGLTVRLSVLFLLVLVGNPLAVWITVWLTHAFADFRRPAATLQQAWRFVAASLVATTAMLVLVIAVNSLIAQTGSAGLVLMGAIWLVFNLLTCTWYAAMMNDEPDLWASLWEAAIFGLRRWRPLWARVAFPLLFAGFLVCYRVKTESSTPPPLPSSPVLPTGGTVNSTSSGTLGSSSTSNIKQGWTIQLQWVLSADRGNYWLEDTTAQAEETPWPISRYIVDTLTVLVETYFIVAFSLIYIRRPITVKPDRRFGFEVLPPRAGPADASPLPALPVSDDTRF